MKLEIIYQDDYLVAINKPPGLLVHRTRIAMDADLFALQILRDQIGQHVYPIHRLDRKTSGVLLFGLNEEIHKTMQQAFAGKQIKKTYLAIVRGYTEETGTIDYPLRKENGGLQDAITAYRTLDRTEIDLPFGKHATSRYSLVEVHPETGRQHPARLRCDQLLSAPHGAHRFWF